MSIEIGKRIKELRIKKGFSQTKLASLTGIENVTLSKYENGQQEPGVQNLIKLSDELNTSMDYIVRGGEDSFYSPNIKRNKSEGYKVAKEIIDLYELKFLDVNEMGDIYFFNKYGIREFLASYKSIMGEDSKDEPGYDKFIETKIKNFAKKYDREKDQDDFFI